MELSTMHSAAALDFYNNPTRSKADFEAFAKEHGVVLFGEQRTYPEWDWADVVMSLFDSLE